MLNKPANYQILMSGLKLLGLFDVPEKLNILIEFDKQICWVYKLQIFKIYISNDFEDIHDQNRLQKCIRVVLKISSPKKASPEGWIRNRKKKQISRYLITNLEEKSYLRNLRKNGKSYLSMSFEEKRICNKITWHQLYELVTYIL